VPLMPWLYSRPLDQATVPSTHWLVWLTPPSRSIVVHASELQAMDSAGLAALLAIRSDALKCRHRLPCHCQSTFIRHVIESRVRPQAGSGRLGAGSRMQTTTVARRGALLLDHSDPPTPATLFLHVIAGPSDPESAPDGQDRLGDRGLA
jgi:hypothetical protein